MKLFDKVWSALGLVEAEEPEEQTVKPAEKTGSRQERKSDRPLKQADENKPLWSSPAEPISPLPVSPQQYKPTQTVALPASQAIGAAKLILTQPSGFDDARQIAENVTNGKTVVVNFDRTDADTTKRTIDFMSGITYAVGGTVQRISSTIFLFAPANVEVYANERQYADEAAVLPWRGQKTGRDH